MTSSPEYAQSNGLVERHIQTVKNVLLKMFSDGKSLWEALAAICSTPVSSLLPYAPSVLLQGRNLRGSLPFISSSLVHIGSCFGGSRGVGASSTESGIYSTPFS